MKYVDGFLLPVPRKNLRAYAAMARKAGKIWMEHGALAFKECVGEDLAPGFGLPFPALMKLKRGEVPLFSFIVFRSRSHRDRVNAKVMKDPRMHATCGTTMPFDLDRMAYGGYRTLVDL